jgi:acid phosphatase type 7
MSADQVVRLNWKCSKADARGWIHVGDRGDTHADIGCDIVVDGLPLGDSSVDCISSRHSLQTLGIIDALYALRELRRVLRPGGVLRLCLFDLDRELEGFSGGRDDPRWHDWDTRSGNFISHLLRFNYVKTPLNFEFARELLEKAGFESIRRSTCGQTSGPHAEVAELDIGDEYSFYVEAFRPRAAPVAVTEGEAPSRICLSWTEDPSTTLTVTWRAPTRDGPPGAEIREPGLRDWNRVEGKAVDTLRRDVLLHRATFRGLKPNTEYEYRVSGDDPRLVRTAPMPGPADFSFGFICDTGVVGRRDGLASGTRQIIEVLAQTRPLFVLGGGDYAYADRDQRFRAADDGIEAWHRQMEPLVAHSPLMAQLGNHEVLLGERFRDWAMSFSHWDATGDERSYSFRVGDVHFAALFVVAPVFDESLMLWLDRDLFRAREGGARWLIVYQHEPIFAHGRSHPAHPRTRQLLTPILERHHVDLHLSGHDQNYERTVPLTRAWPVPAAQSTQPRDHYRAGEGVIYAKVSPGGKKSDKRRDFSRFFADQQPFVAVRDDTRHHCALITVRAAGELLVEVIGVTDGAAGPGAVEHVDSFRIVQPASEGAGPATRTRPRRARGRPSDSVA